MTVIPSKDLRAVELFETITPAWALHHVDIGLTSAQVAEMVALTQAARAAFSAQHEAQSAARAATVEFHNAIRQMREKGSEQVATIKAFAMTTDAAQVYVKALIPMPASPTPAPAPGKPENITFELQGSGAITLRWQAINAAPNAGTFFVIKRQRAGEDMYTLVGNSGEKHWTDFTLPAGTPFAAYMVQGFRGKKSGPESNCMTVQFGTDEQSFTTSTASTASQRATKLAA